MGVGSVSTQPEGHGVGWGWGVDGWGGKWEDRGAVGWGVCELVGAWGHSQPVSPPHFCLALSAQLRCP